jgi:argininosuccinate synthase
MASFNTEDVAGIAQSDATGVAKYHGLQERLANDVKASVSKPELATDGSGETDGSDADDN